MSTPQEGSQPDFSATAHGYALNREYAASVRLNLQHYLWNESLGFLLHPAITSSLPSNSKPRIADVGVGTGLLLLELADRFPDAQLDGFDLDCAQAPPAPWLPSNVTLSELNILKDLPEHLVGAFDVVHVRLFILVVENGDPRPILQNLLRVLKPGGWLQWDEVDPEGHSVVWSGAAPAESNERVASINQLMELIRANGRHAWISKLDAILKELGGVEDVQRHVYADSPQLLKANSDQHMMTMDEFAARMERIGNEELGRRVRGLIAGAVGVMGEKGGAYTMPRSVCLGRRKSGDA